MGDTLRSIAEGMEHRTVSGCSIPQWSELVARGLTHFDHDENCCSKCRLEAVLGEYEKVDLVKQWRKEADDFDITCGDSEVEGAFNRCAAELETWLAVNLERIKAQARTEEAKWWWGMYTEGAPAVCDKRIAALEAQAKGKP